MEVKVTKVSLRSTKPNSFDRSSSFKYHLKIQVVYSTEFSVSCGAFNGITHQNTKYCPFHMAIMYIKSALALHHVTFGKLFLKLVQSIQKLIKAANHPNLLQTELHDAECRRVPNDNVNRQVCLL